MTRFATDRLIVSVLLSLAGALIAVLAGMAEVALFVTPWLVLCVLGITHQDDPRLQVDVVVDKDRLLVGDSIDVQVTVSAASETIVTVTPRPSDNFGATAEATCPIVELASADRRAVMTFAMPVDEWGTHDLGAMAVDSSHAYGLFRSQATMRQRRAIRVHPTPRQLKELLAPRQVRRVSGTHQSRESAQGIEYADLRQFTAGDSVRDINWRASARTGDLWVSQRHPDRATDVVLLVDSFIETGHDVRQVFGLIVDASTSIAESHLAVTDRVGLVEFGGVVRWVTPATGRVQLQRLTDAILATGLYSNAADKEFPILPARALPPRSFIIAFTPLLDDRFVDAIFAARGRGHDVAVIECLLSAVESGEAESGAGEPGAGEPDGASHSHLVARRFWEAERAMLRDRMAEQGIAVVGWDGRENLDLVLGQLMRRRRGGRARSR